MSVCELRHNFSRDEIVALYELPLPVLMLRAQQVHAAHFDPVKVQASTLLSIKTGACPEDCKYCPQSAHYHTDIKVEKLLDVETVLNHAHAAKAAGATRFCMGAAWRSPKDKDVEKVSQLVREVKALGLETCATLGMLSASQAHTLKSAGLDYYNHNLDTAPEHYHEIISTRQFEERLDTLSHVREAGMKVCCGGIIGMNESRSERAGLLQALANLPEHPESVPINQLVRVAGTPLAEAEQLDPFEFVRTIAIARILMPKSYVRLSAGRENMSEALQAMCLLAGANSIFYGERLLTTGNPDIEADRHLLSRMGMELEGAEAGRAESKHIPIRVAA
jgi:biotin synthase